MTEQNRIEKGLWWDRAWTLVEGCTPMDRSCDHCWSAEQAYMRGHQRNERIRSRYAGLTDQDGHWTGEVRVQWDALELPLRVRKETTWAIWNDLFHEDVPDEFIQRALWRMSGHNGECRHHTFVILTKRSQRMREFILRMCPEFDIQFPNVVLGVSVPGDGYQGRIYDLVRTPAAKRVVSYEPALGPVDIMRYLCTIQDAPHFDAKIQPRIDGVIAGGETGLDARAAPPAWFRSVRDQCIETGVHFFFKSWGEWAPRGEHTKDIEKVVTIDMARVGKARAGRLLDGRTWDQLAWQDAAPMDQDCMRVMTREEHRLLHEGDR